MMKLGKLIVGLGAVVLVGSVIPHFDRETYIVKVTDKERIVEKSGESIDSKYLVYTTLQDGSVRVFENTDSPLEFKWNSSDVYAKLEDGQTFSIRTYGFRIPFFSMYENIIGMPEPMPSLRIDG